MEIAALVILGSLTAACVAALCYAVWVMAGVIRRQGDAITATTDYQIERIKVEQGAEAVARYARTMASTAPQNNGFRVPAEEPDLVIPNRGG